MAKTLDFNKWTGPSMTIVFQDKAKTKIKVGMPTEGLQEELAAKLPQLEAALAANNAETIEAIYDLAARLMSRNYSDTQVTVEDLRSKYKCNLEMLTAFFVMYLEFINETADAKN